MKPSAYIRGFDGLRAFSIALVVIAHLGLLAWFPDTAFWQKRVFHLVSGTMGVYVFFAISGFLITSLLLREKERNGRISFRKFYIRRLLRLAPTLLVFYVVTAVLILSNMLPNEKVGWLISLAYLYNFVPYRYYMVELGHTWSLAVEEQFYLLWPFVIKGLKGYKVLWVSFLVMAGCVLALLSFPTLEFNLGSLNINIVRDFPYRGTRFLLPAVGPIMVGAVFGLIYHYRKAATVRHMGAWYTVVIAVVLYAVPLYLPISLFAFKFIIQSVGISMFLCWLTQNQETALVRVLEWGPLAFIGRISYGIYVWQGLFLRTGPGGQLWIQQFPQNLALTLAVAVISYYTIETRALKLKDRFR